MLALETLILLQECASLAVVQALCLNEYDESTRGRIVPKLHVAAYVMHCNSSQAVMHCVWCSLFTLSGGKGHVDAWPAWHRLHTGISVCVH